MPRPPKTDRAEPLVPNRLEQRVLAASDAVGAFIETWGFRAIHGRVWTLLALRSAPMAQTEVAETLGVSGSMVSLAMSELTHFGLVHPLSEHRNAPYEARLDVWPTITDVIRGREWMLIERARVALEAAVDEAEQAQAEGSPSPYDIDRLRLLLRMSEFAQVVLRTVLGVRMPRSLDAFSRWLGGAGRVLSQVQARLPST